ncbi:MAG TPA: hypothetical protein VGB74_03520, partial [Actinoplanes sp.]
MTGPLPPGDPRAEAAGSGRQSNGVRSDSYSSPDSPDEPAEEFVFVPGHGSVGVFQAPQPVRPRGPAGDPGAGQAGNGPVDSTLDIDSPFLDLFG